jgi:hypothetical protein
MQKWEYHVWYLDTSLEAQSIRDDLERWGQEGWELVAVTPHESSVSGAVLVAMFKRPTQPASPIDPVFARG